MTYKLATILLLLSYSTIVFSQTEKDTQRMIRKAENHFYSMEYNQALGIYLELLKSSPNSFDYNYKAGMCYLNSNIEADKCLDYFLAARKNMSLPNDSTADLYYYIAHSYKVNDEFENAINYFEKSKSMIDRSYDSLNLFFVNEEIEQCKRGIESKSQPRYARLFNLGEGVNSRYPDYSSVVVPHQSLLAFTTTRKGNANLKFHKQDEYFEDVYLVKDNWTESLTVEDVESEYYEPNFARVSYDSAFSAGVLINTESHDAAISMHPDEKRMFLFSQNTLWLAEIKDGKLVSPMRYNYVLGGEKRYESSLDLTPDNKVIYFVSNQARGIGGKDIYRSEVKEDGTWSTPENLGPVINTNFDEESVYYDPYDSTLYFSSRGHSSIGGFDVFKSKFDNNVWSQPENLGFSINSGTDDVFFTYDGNSNVGYLSSMRKGGVGNYDLYMVRFFKPLNVDVAVTYSDELKPINSKLTMVSVKNGDSVQVVMNRIRDVNYKSNEKFLLKAPQYDNDSVVDVFEFETPESYGDYPYYQEVSYEKVTNHKGQLVGYKTTLYNAFFDIEQVFLNTGKKVTSAAEKFKEYSSLVQSMKSENKYFQKMSKIHYIDTTIYAILEEQLASRALAAGIEGEVKVPTSPEAAKEILATVGTTPIDSLITVSKVATKPVEKVEEEVKAPAPSKPIAKKEEKKPAPVVNASALSPILFQFSSQSLTTTGKAQLEALYTYLTENKDVKLKILGYTDAKGTEAKNTDLATRRAIEVKLLLIEKGIDKKRLKAVGKGDQDPVAPNVNADGSDNPEGRSLNRRVEFKVF